MFVAKNPDQPLTAGAERFVCQHRHDDVITSDRVNADGIHVTEECKQVH